MYLTLTTPTTKTTTTGTVTNGTLDCRETELKGSKEELKILQLELSNSQKAQMKQNQIIDEQQNELSNKATVTEALNVELRAKISHHGKQTNDLQNLQTKCKAAYDEVSKMESNLKQEKGESSGELREKSRSESTGLLLR